MKMKAGNLHFQILNNEIKNTKDKYIEIENCLGQRYIASGLSEKSITIKGTPGNALGAYLDGADITVYGNAQDATGDTMSAGTICVYGSSGDATGYAMRGGKIFVQGSAGYRAGIHMKAYKDIVPVLVIGGCAGSFLGEYLSGGRIIVLGIGADGKVPAGNFLGSGMHGGKIYLRCTQKPQNLPKQVEVRKAGKEDMAEIKDDIAQYCRLFGYDEKELEAEPFYVLAPNTKNPYQQMYTYN